MKMHWCTGKINLSGQGFTVIVYNEFKAVSWPEMQVLIALHGDENVFDIKPCSVSETSPSEEKRRLLGKYGPIADKVFPGRVFRMEMVMPGEPTGQPQADGFGEPVPVSEQQSEGELSEDAVQPPPSAGAVFKPGRHARPSTSP